MKVVYIINDEFTKNSSVLKKVNNQIAQWYTLGIKTHLYIIGVNKSAAQDFIFNEHLEGFTYFNSPIANLFGGTIYRNLNRQLSVIHLLKTIKRVNPDLIYLREVQYFAFFDKVLKSRPSVIELNSLYLNEIGNLSQYKQNLIKRNQRTIFSSVAGFVCVTNEIAQQIISYQKPWVCCSNGVNMNAFDNQFIDQSAVNIVMICSPGMAWHGVEKLEILSKAFPQYQFHLIGPTLDYKATNLIQHGLLGKEDINRLYKSMNIALGCLSLYKKCMNESCSLKVREYLMYGLPMIMGERDVDITGQPFVLEIGNYENNVKDNIEGIHNFIEKYKYVRLNKEQVRQLVSIEVKEKIRTDFFKKIIE
jgi:hypothetical protein